MHDAVPQPLEPSLRVERSGPQHLEKNELTQIYEGMFLLDNQVVREGWKEAKAYGAGKRIEGNFREGDGVVVVDDVITTGGSTLKAIDAIEAAGGRILFAFVLVDREEGGREALEARGQA